MRPIKPTAGPRWRWCTGTSTHTGSTSGLIPSGAHWRRRIVPLRPRRPITSPISPWPRRLFFRREIVAFRSAAERTIALNPMDSSTTAYLGHLMAHAGDWERGCALVERARQLNPNHPGWYWFAAFWDAYRKRDYRGALEVALKINMPGDFYVPAVIAAAYGQLGELDSSAHGPAAAARDEARLCRNRARGNWKVVRPRRARRALSGWSPQGGAGDCRENGSAAPAPDLARSSAADSGVARAEEGFWVAVLPFKYSGANADLTALADGLSEDIVTGLSRFSYLRVIARSSTSRYVNEAVDVRAAGKELGARYVMEGNLRQAGAKVAPRRAARGRGLRRSSLG